MQRDSQRARGHPSPRPQPSRHPLRGSLFEVPEDAIGDPDDCNLRAIHGNINLTNIPWFKEAPDPDGMGTLVMTDFGLSGSDLRSKAFDVENNFTRSFDIWSLGCLYLDMIAWLVGGLDLTHEFPIARRAPRSDGGLFFSKILGLLDSVSGVRASKVVIEFLVELHSHPACKQFIHDFLDLIENGMLVIGDGGETGNRRLTSMLVCAMLTEFERKMQENEAYGLVPVPRSPTGQPQCDEREVFRGSLPPYDKKLLCSFPSHTSGLRPVRRNLRAYKFLLK
ncbi:hypothetical protein B0T26DRAFT_679290 [Lasiosphaeria miniovina]|uniref:Protein kinase domain-containing protein n=1 Tax=Lasiosphaeria miniovina TaxID=1954250 RepID=A0AA40A5Z5_9PEZI|nr:uncharacterized protein B0T26DRAFT_679290 [Lasiosphaeria miniovina]KAK0709944.1 hypothetical protein B0T26DRAFT_679290 [Lasiosphaeria miniovina]